MVGGHEIQTKDWVRHLGQEKEKTVIMAAKIQAVPTVLYAGITAPLTPRRRGLEDGRGDEFETILTVAPSTKYLMLLSESRKKMRRAPNSDDEANCHRTSLADFPTNCRVAHIAQSSSSDSSRAPASIYATPTSVRG